MKKLFTDFIEGFRLFRKSPKKYIVTVVLGVILIAYSIEAIANRKDSITDYTTIVSEEAFCLNGESVSFRDIAFYVAYEESQVQKEALVYDPEDPNSYWNLHTDGVFIRDASRNAALQMALHDWIFYQLALADGLTLTPEEEEALASHQEDFWADLTEDGKDVRLGVSREDIDAAMERMMYAQAYQEIYAALYNAATEDYDFSADAYQTLYEDQDIEINESIWGKLRFGSLTFSS